MKKPHRVALVFDREYGKKLYDLADTMHTWIIGTRINRYYVERYWQDHPSEQGYDEEHGVVWKKIDLDHGVTLMEDENESFSTELLGDIDNHHGEYAHDPPLSEILVIGLPLTDEVMAVIEDYELTIEDKNENSFLLKF